MSRDRGALTVLAAALLGGVVGALGVSLVPSMRGDPGREEFERRLAEQEVRLLEDLARLDERVGQAEAGLAALGAAPEPPDASAALEAFREAVRAELERVEERLGAIEEDLAEVAVGFVRVRATEAQEGPLSANEQRFWAARSRDQDPGERFSALVVLGAERTDIGVQVCLERLAEPGETTIVVWQALRNLGSFRERSAAGLVASFLEHERAVVRAAAYDALRLMGAPESDYDAASSAQDRRSATEALLAWAERQ